MSIANRILLTISLSAVALLALAGIMMVRCWDTSAGMNRLAVSGQVVQQLADLVSSLQRERGRTAQFSRPRARGAVPNSRRSAASATG